MSDLSQGQIQRVATLLNTRPTDSLLIEMIGVIESAVTAQQDSDKYYQDYRDANTSGNSLYKQSQTLIDALKTVQQTLAEMPEYSAQLLDGHYDSANKDNVRLAIRPEEMELWRLEQQNPNGSGFVVLVDRMLNAATSAAENVIRHGPGQGKLARNYTPALIRLADGLEEVFPDLKVGSGAKSPFSRLCDYFLNTILESPAGITEIKRQIDNMIKVRNERERK